MFDERPICTICNYPVAEVQCCEMPFCLFCINKHDHYNTPKAIKWGKREISGIANKGIPNKGIPRKDIIEKNGKKYRIVLLE